MLFDLLCFIAYLSRRPFYSSFRRFGMGKAPKKTDCYADLDLGRGAREVESLMQLDDVDSFSTS